MPNLVRVIRFSASPCFLLLALLLYSNRDVMLQICGLTQPTANVTIFGQPMELTMGSLGSMWVMYVLMAIFHSGPWFALLSNGADTEGCCEKPEPERMA